MRKFNRFTIVVIAIAAIAAPLTAAAQTRITDDATNGGTSRDSYDPKVNGDGTRVTFRSDADLLSEGRADNDYEIWLWDSSTGFTRVTDATTNGATGRDSYLPSIDDTGNRIAFQSDADLLSEGRVANDEEIWLFGNPVPVELMSFSVE